MNKKLLVLCLFLAGCATTPSSKIIVQPDTVSMLPAAWIINQIEGQSWGMPPNPKANGSGGWYFLFPPSDGVHYVRVPYNALKPHRTLVLTYRVSPVNGVASFTSVETGCNESADFRPMIERAGDQMTVNQEFYRWWSGPPVKLVADGQIHIVSYPLTWDKWTSVFGHTNQSEFDTTMKGNIMTVGITFGGGCFAGHGDYGIGKFECLNFQMQ